MKVDKPQLVIFEKEKDINTLKALGISKQGLKSLFFKHNLLINIIGGVLGICFSVLLVYLQNRFSVFKIPGSVTINGLCILSSLQAFCISLIVISS